MGIIMRTLISDLEKVARLKQENTILKFELKEVLKAIVRHRRQFATPMFVKEFNREVTLDFDDPLYPYCPYRLTESELLKYVEKGNYGEESRQ